jgi:hypothetical protein
VSADYLLGFIDTKRKDESAEKVRQEFGLSDEAMEVLKKNLILPLFSILISRKVRISCLS